jgi:hypothetical protein
VFYIDIIFNNSYYYYIGILGSLDKVGLNNVLVVSLLLLLFSKFYILLIIIAVYYAFNIVLKLFGEDELLLLKFDKFKLFNNYDID